MILGLSNQMRDINADTTTAAIAGSADAAAAAAASAAAASIPSLKHAGDLGGDAGETSTRQKNPKILFNSVLVSVAPPRKQGNRMGG